MTGVELQEHYHPGTTVRRCIVENGRVLNFCKDCGRVHSCDKNPDCNECKENRNDCLNFNGNLEGECWKCKKKKKLNRGD